MFENNLFLAYLDKIAALACRSMNSQFFRNLKK
jgi:hypothetical protein